MFPTNSIMYVTANVPRFLEANFRWWSLYYTIWQFGAPGCGKGNISIVNSFPLGLPLPIFSLNFIILSLLLLRPPDNKGRSCRWLVGISVVCILNPIQAICAISTPRQIHAATTNLNFASSLLDGILTRVVALMLRIGLRRSFRRTLFAILLYIFLPSHAQIRLFIRYTSTNTCSTWSSPAKFSLFT